MACNCISKSEEKIREHLKEQHPDWEIITGLYNNKTWIYDGPQQGIVLTNEFEATYTKTNLDGSKSKSKKHIVQLFAQYCPFCGEKKVADKPGEEHIPHISQVFKDALIDARDTLLLVSLLDGSSTTGAAIERADQVLGIEDHNTSISLQIAKKEATDEL